MIAAMKATFVPVSSWMGNRPANHSSGVTCLREVNEGISGIILYKTETRESMFGKVQQREVRMVASVSSISEINHTQYNQLNMGAIRLPLNYYAVLLPRNI
jgi:hypothetical protein